MKRPTIFVTNDDGVHSKGFASLIEIAKEFGSVVGVAPEYAQSGKSHAITMNRPLRLREVVKQKDVLIYACDGTPVDCVKIGFDYLWEESRPDFALSGINHGSNSSISVIYSGTMGAATEASFYGIPSIGLSLLDHDDDADFKAAKHYGKMIIKSIMESNPTTGLCLNVNIPKLPLDQIKGVRVCRQNMGYYRERFSPRNDPMGKEYFWLTGELINLEPNSHDNDERLLNEGYITIVPVRADLTDHNQIAPLAEILDIVI